MDIIKKFFTIRAVRNWNKLPREEADAHIWRLSRSGWRGCEHSDLAVGVPAYCRGVGPIICKGLFLLKLFCFFEPVSIRFIPHSHFSIKKTVVYMRPALLLLTSSREALCPFLEDSQHSQCSPWERGTFHLAVLI